MAKANHQACLRPALVSKLSRAGVPFFLTTRMLPNSEREMTRYQRGLVDTCFEEGQYESGIALLDQLRSSSFKPPPDHVRQLLFIALFPPPPSTGDPVNNQEQFPPSPTKGSPTKQRPTLSKVSLSPSVAESEAAQRVLFSFLATNSPASIFRALPRYPLDAGAQRDPGVSESGHDEDSVVARESLCIKDCKHCWVILKEGFIQRKKLLPQNASRRRGRGVYDIQNTDLDPGRGIPVVVAEYAWPILQWLVSLFEKDESLNFQTSKEKFSLLLLSQIPPPRGGTGPRWEADAPLDIVFHSVEQEDGERREIATRLLTLLIHLTFSGSFDGSMFAATLATRLCTTSPQTAQLLMESLPKTDLILAFKITVCQKFLSSGLSITGRAKPRPRPLSGRGSRCDSGIIPSATDTDVGRIGSSLPPRPALAACSEVFQLLYDDHASQSSASIGLIRTIKYVLLVSFAHLQELLPPGERDGDWKDALSNGGLKRVVDTAFPGGSMYHTALSTITSFWLAG